jgi:hypothetical protein
VPSSNARSRSAPGLNHRHLRNVSRGESSSTRPSPAKDEEITVEFRLDDETPAVSPTAQVVWIQPNEAGPDGVGLRFLEIDAPTIGQLEHFVSDHYPRLQSVPA